MDGESLAKRRRLNDVEEAFRTDFDQRREQSHPRDRCSQVRDISIPFEKLSNLNTWHAHNARASLDCGDVPDTLYERRGRPFQQVDDTPKLKNLSLLDQLSFARDEAPLETVSSIARAAEDNGTGDFHDVSEGQCDAREESEVCFGMVCLTLPTQPTEGLYILITDAQIMIPDIAILEPRILSPNAGRVAVQLVNGQLTTLSGDQHGKNPVGSIQDRHNLESVQQMQCQSSLRLQMYCQSQPGIISRTQAPKIAHAQCSLSVIIYGPGTTFDIVGDYLQACGLYLQDPEHCDYNTPYKNPHCLASPGEYNLKTSSLQVPPSTVESAHDPSCIFDGLSGMTQLDETETPVILKTPLER